MPCCGQNRPREHFRYQPVTRPAPPAARAPGPETRLRFVGRSAILVRGPMTGRSYAFTKPSAEQPVSRADVDALLRTGLFVVTR